MTIYTRFDVVRIINNIIIEYCVLNNIKILNHSRENQ